MTDLTKLVVIIVRLQALGFLLSAVAHWALLASFIVIASLRGTNVTSAASETYGVLSLIYLVIAVILYFRSRSLASYLIKGVAEVS